YDALGRTVRRDWRAGAALLALVPALYAAYAFSVRELALADLAAASFFAAVPALALWRADRSRQPTIFDALALAYLAASLWLGLLPALTLPEQGGLVGFLQLASVPLLLLLFAIRGWPGVGFTWHLSGRDLRDALLAGLAALLVALAAALAGGQLGPAARTPSAGDVLLAAVGAYFFTALPAELLLRGGIQNGLARALAPTMGATGAWVALAAAAVLWAALGMLRGGWPGLAYGAAVGAAAGWTYLRTGKVTAAAVTHALVALGVGLLAGP
ncbi:MAG TPA: CPBP family glutamic-type intramembrane protease, partial [Chloroflexaceae bacterium]|nr:CPBP family glutamic-type intramembrane protease [Chloroflexaceae bacterium]